MGLVGAESGLKIVHTVCSTAVDLVYCNSFAIISYICYQYKYILYIIIFITVIISLLYYYTIDHLYIISLMQIMGFTPYWLVLSGSYLFIYYYYLLFTTIYYYSIYYNILLLFIILLTLTIYSLLIIHCFLIDAN
jgi:hypothetical protein